MCEKGSKKSKCIREEIRRRINSGNACYHSAENFLASRLFRMGEKLSRSKRRTQAEGVSEQDGEER
jgi:hypothetical protein